MCLTVSVLSFDLINSPSVRLCFFGVLFMYLFIYFKHEKKVRNNQSSRESGRAFPLFLCFGARCSFPKWVD